MPKTNGRASRGANWKYEADARRNKKLAKQEYADAKKQREMQRLASRVELFKAQTPGTLFSWFDGQHYLLITWIRRGHGVHYRVDDPLGYDGLFITKDGITQRTWVTMSSAKIIGKAVNSR